MEETLQKEAFFAARPKRPFFVKLLSSISSFLRKEKSDAVVCNDLEITIDTTENGVRIALFPGEQVAYNERLHKLQMESEQIERIYGSNYLKSYERIVLPPFSITLHNEKNVWLSAILYVFKNKMAILKLELPILDTPFFMLQEVGIDHLIKQISPSWAISSAFEKPSIQAVWMAYLNTINEYAKLERCQTEQCLQNTILIQFDDRPKHIQHLSDDLLFEFYRIVSAPVKVSKDNFPLAVQKAKDYMCTHFMGDIGIRYFFNIAGSCLSIVDKSTQDVIEERILACHSKIDEYEVDYYLTSSAYVNLEFSLIILLLKTLNSTVVFNEKLLNRKDFAKAQRAFNKNRIFIALMQENCYGSVSEQVALVEEMMPYYRKLDIEIEKATAIDQIILEERSQKNERYQQNTTALGMLLALVVGLPSIVETIKILRPGIMFLPKDIPYATIEGVSLVLWVILVAVLVIVVRKKY